jgi:thiaminase/transcriptional activator TenA
MSWCEEAWRRAGPVLEAIAIHPFIGGLADGGLPKEKFLHYLAQDSVYLDDFAKVLSGLALGAPGPDEAAALAGFASQAVAVERALHQGFLGGAARPEASPTTALYTGFLYQRLVRGPWAVGLAAVLPCFWIYQEVGDRIAELHRAAPIPGHPYREWIGAYGGAEYAAAVRLARDMTDRAALDSTDRVRAGMLEAFGTASKMEWMFWDAAWRLEGWPL